MVRYCSECRKEGGFFEIKNRDLPLSKTRELCGDCYNNIFSKEKEERQKIMEWKNRIIRTFYEGTVVQLCREQGIDTMEKRWTTAVSRRGTRYQRQYNYYFTFEELVALLVKNVSLKKIIDFAKRKGVPIREILLEIDQYYAKKNLVNDPGVIEINDGQYLKILEKIDLFKPLLPYYPNELPYQIDLARYLLQYFPNARVEEQRSSARPDIIIDNIAIEIKGPTGERELDTIANKCLRYSLYFEKGLIIVLFDVKVTSRYLDDWQKGVKEKFPHVAIKCK
jgi:hypothetical protein